MSAQKKMILRRTVSPTDGETLRTQLWTIATKYQSLLEYFSSTTTPSRWSVVDHALVLTITSAGEIVETFTFSCEKQHPLRQEGHLVLETYKIDFVSTDLLNEGTAYQIRVIHKNNAGRLLSHLLIHCSDNESADTIDDELSEDGERISLLTEVSLSPLLHSPYIIANSL